MRTRLLLLGAVLLAFGGSLVAGFHVDDYGILSDPALKSAHGLPGMWGWRHTQPLTHLTFWLNYQAGGQEPLGYHLLNLVLHLGAVLLAYECLRRLLPERAAFIAAAVFAVHPLQAEAVNYVAARGVVLAALLCFTALLAWLEERHWMAVVCFAVALLASEQCAAFPILLPIVARRRLAPIATMLVLSAAAVLRWALVSPGTWSHAGGYLLQQSAVTWRYLRLLVVPWGFSIDPDIGLPPAWLGVLAWLAIAGVMALATVVVKKRKGRPADCAKWLIAALLLLLPASLLLPSRYLAADSRMYLPLFALAAAIGILLSGARLREVAIAVTVLLTVLSVWRTYVWTSDERLWREAVRRAPQKARPKVQLAKTVRAAEALELLAQARELEPHNSEVAAETGKVLLDEQQYDGALTELSRALSLDPLNALALNNRGVAFAALSQVEAARADFESALRLDPDFAEARENLNRLSAR